MIDRLQLVLFRIGQRLWVRPLIASVLSICGALFAKTADGLALAGSVPEVPAEAVETLLSILSTSMLVIASLAVASMVAAYSSASTTATPRSFPLVLSDDVSQNALAGFVGAFIYGVVAQVAVTTGYYGRGGRFVLFALTILVLVAVILTFVRWVDRIARLGRMGTTIAAIETATRDALDRRRRAPRLGGAAPVDHGELGVPVHGTDVGYVQHFDVEALHRYAVEADLRIRVSVQPGDFATRTVPLAHVLREDPHVVLDHERVAKAFSIGQERAFETDPVCGLLALSEIASRALSPAVNDPGTAVAVLGAQVRLFAGWSEPQGERERGAVELDRVEVSALRAHDLVTHAFRAIGRDGAGLVEVAERLQEALASIAAAGDDELRRAAKDQARQALERAERALVHDADVEAVRRAATLVHD